MEQRAGRLLAGGFFTPLRSVQNDVDALRSVQNDVNAPSSRLAQNQPQILIAEQQLVQPLDHVLDLR